MVSYIIELLLYFHGQCYMSQQTCGKVEGFTYFEGGTHKETQCPQRSLKV